MAGFFLPPESYSFVKLQLLAQSQELIYLLAESSSTSPLHCKPGSLGVGSVEVQWHRDSLVGKVQCSSLLPFHITTKWKLREFCLAPLILLVCEWKVNPTPAPGLKAVSCLYITLAE